MFDYSYFHISQFSEELKTKIDEHEKIDCYNFRKDTLEKLIECQKIIEMAGKLAKEVEWLYRGDTGEDTFAERYKEII